MASLLTPALYAVLNQLNAAYDIDDRLADDEVLELCRAVIREAGHRSDANGPALAGDDAGEFQAHRLRRHLLEEYERVSAPERAQRVRWAGPQAAPAMLSRPEDTTSTGCYILPRRSAASGSNRKDRSGARLPGAGLA